MKKTLYSLMLSEEVMREIDRMAHKLGTNRSNLVNRILAEYAQIQTPEQQLNDIFGEIEHMLAASRELVPLIAPNTRKVAVRSGLAYKYHPTLHYEVELRHGFVIGEPIGTLCVSFRTRSQELLELLREFFVRFEQIEQALLPIQVNFSFENGRFWRELAYPVSHKNTSIPTPLSADDVARAITDYVSLVDSMLKACVAGAGVQQLTEMYAADLKRRPILI